MAGKLLLTYLFTYQLCTYNFAHMLYKILFSYSFHIHENSQTSKNTNLTYCQSLRVKKKIDRNECNIGISCLTYHNTVSVLFLFLNFYRAPAVSRSEQVGESNQNDHEYI